MCNRGGVGRAAIALLVVALPVSAQSGDAQASVFAVKKCDTPRVPIGWLHRASGRVSYTLGKDGNADTTSVNVVSVLGMSVAGYRSVAVRELSACKFDMGKNAPKTGVSVSQVIGFVGDSMQLRSAELLSDFPTALTIEPTVVSLDSFPLPINDRRMEELPMLIKCRESPGANQTIHGQGGTAAQAQQDAAAQMLEYSKQRNGSMMAEVVVEADGHVRRITKVLSITNQTALNTLTDMALHCEYVPARVLGVAVPSLAHAGVGHTVTFIR